MSESIGKNIKKLRKERGLTQEELAELLGVSFQAVSKWENESGMPDISQVIPLANVFGVTTDTLFGTETMDTSGEIDDFIRENTYKQCNCPDEEDFVCLLECVNEIQDKLKTCPSNYRLLSYSISNILIVIEKLTEEGRKDEATKWQNEMIRQANVVLNHCTDVDHLNSVNSCLVDLYLLLENYPKAEEHARRLPCNFDFNNRYSVLGYVMIRMGKREEALKLYASAVYSALRLLEYELRRMGRNYAIAQEYDKAYECFALFPDIYDLIMRDREADIPFYIYQSYDQLAVTCMNLGRYDEAIDHLERYLRVERTVAETYNIVTESKIPYFYGRTLKYSQDHYISRNEISDVMAWSEFDPIRETERFRTLLKEVAEFEEKYRD